MTSTRTKSPMSAQANSHPALTSLSYIEASCVATARGIASVAVAGMLVLAILTLVDVTLRYFFSAPLPGLNEASGLLMAVIIAATFPVGIMARNHITIDLLNDLLGKRLAKLGETIGAILILAFIAIIAWRFGVHANRLMMRGDETMMVGF